MSSYYVDAHSHQKNPDSEVKTLLSLSYPEANFPSDALFHYGLHPWHAQTFEAGKFEQQLKLALQSANFVALGECGLDKLKGPSLSRQQEVFRAQLELAIKHNIGIVIIHCVRAYSDILEISDACSYRGVLVFHDFNASFEIAQELIKRGHILCLGKTLERENSKVPKYLKLDWLDQMLVETDDETCPIQRRYQQLGQALGKPTEFVCERIWQNALRLFPQLKGEN